MVRSRRIIQACPGETGDFLPVIHWDETDDLAVIVRLIDHNVWELLTDVVNLDGDSAEQVGCNCHLFTSLGDACVVDAEHSSHTGTDQSASATHHSHP